MSVSDTPALDAYNASVSDPERMQRVWHGDNT